MFQNLKLLLHVDLLDYFISACVYLPSLIRSMAAMGKGSGGHVNPPYVYVEFLLHVGWRKPCFANEQKQKQIIVCLSE